MTTLVTNMLRGARSVFYLFPSVELRTTRFTNMPETAQKAFESDQKKLGGDFRGAVKVFEKSLPDVKK